MEAWLSESDFGLLLIVGIKKKQCKGEQDIGFCSKFTKVKIFVILSSRFRPFVSASEWRSERKEGSEWRSE
ncbi:hypothetical protein R6Q57_024270 [Mikania cordata]